MNQVRLKHLVRINPTDLPETTDQDYEFRYLDIGAVGRGRLIEEPEALTFGQAPSRARRTVLNGDTILATVRTYLRAVWPVQEGDSDLVVSTGFAVLRPSSVLDPGYLGWVAQSDCVIEEVVARSVGVSYPAINASEVGDVYVPLPPLEQQRRIVNYLDRETARIDGPMTARRRLLHLLDERRGAVRESFTEPLRSSAPNRRLGALVDEVDARVGSASPPALLSVSIHHGVLPFDDANPDRLARADDYESYKVCRSGDLILNRMRAFQGGLGVATLDGMVSPDYSVLRPRPQVASRYLFHVMRSPWFVGEMEARLRGIGGVEQGNVRTPRVNWADLKLISVPTPDDTYQRRIVGAIERNLSNIQALEKGVRRQLNLLAELRNAQITAAVTGELEIPETAA